MRKLEARVTRLMESFETAPVGYWSWILIFLSIVFVRNTLEAFSGLPYIADFANFFPHFFLAYLDPLLALVLALSWVSGEKIVRVSRLMLVCWLLTLLPPLVDLMISKGSGAEIAYAPIGLGEAWPVYLNLFNPLRELTGTTVGIRVEALAACLLGSYYVYLKRGSLRLVPITFVLIYLISVSFFNLPNLYLELSHLLIPEVGTYDELLAPSVLLGPVDNRFPYAIALADLVLAALLVLLWLRRRDKRLFRTVFRLPDVLNASLLGLVGLAGGAYGGAAFSYFEDSSIALHPVNLLRWVAVFCSVFLAALLYLGMREDGDRAEVPVQSTLFFFSVFFAGLVGYAALTLALTLLGLILIARMPPWRLGDRPLVGSILVAAGFTIIFVLGATLFFQDFAPLVIPREALFLVFGIALLSRSGGEFATRVKQTPSWLIRETVPTLLVLASVAAWLPENQPDVAGAANAQKHVYRAKLFERNHDYAHAMIEYRRSFGLGLRDSTAYCDLVSCLEALDQTVEIPPVVVEAEERGARSFDLYLEAAMALMNSGAPELAIPILERGVEHYPTSYRLPNNLALCYAAVGRDHDALDWFKKSIALDPGNPTPHHNLAFLYFRLERYADSEREYRYVLEASPNHLGALKSLTFLWIEKLRNPEKAREFGRRFLSAGPSDAEADLVRQKLADLQEEPLDVADLPPRDRSKRRK
jgi:tetratricopeptide (TPR) repeat protein